MRRPNGPDVSLTSEHPRPPSTPCRPRVPVLVLSFLIPARRFVRFLRGAFSWWNAKTYRAMAVELAANRSLWVLLSVGFSTYFLDVVMKDYAATSGDHVTCIALLPALEF